MGWEKRVDQSTFEFVCCCFYTSIGFLRKKKLNKRSALDEREEEEGWF